MFEQEINEKMKTYEEKTREELLEDIKQRVTLDFLMAESTYEQKRYVRYLEFIRELAWDLKYRYEQEIDEINEKHQARWKREQESEEKVEDCPKKDKKEKKGE